MQCPGWTRLSQARGLPKFFPDIKFWDLLLRFFISEKNLGTWDVMNVARGKFIVILCAGAGCLCMFLPGLVAFIMLFLRWSPILLPYHIFGGKDVLMEMEAQLSLPYGCLLVLDWSIFTGCGMAIYTAATICGEGMLRITLICKALRYEPAHGLMINTLI